MNKAEFRSWLGKRLWTGRALTKKAIDDRSDRLRLRGIDMTRNETGIAADLADLFRIFRPFEYPGANVGTREKPGDKA